MERQIDLDAVADLLVERRRTWALEGVKLGELTWRDAQAGWPQPIVTDRHTVAEPESLGLTLEGPGESRANLVVWSGGWADLEMLLADEVALECATFADVQAALGVADRLVHRLLTT